MGTQMRIALTAKTPEYLHYETPANRAVRLFGAINAYQRMVTSRSPRKVKGISACYAAVSWRYPRYHQTRG